MALTPRQDRYSDAELLYRRAIAIGEKALGPAHPDLATWLTNLAGLLRAQVGLPSDRAASFVDCRDYEQALSPADQTASIFLGTFGPNHPHSQKTAELVRDLKVVQFHLSASTQADVDTDETSPLPTNACT
mmetsp:Transcript_23131/g.72501  ORF Transcript_23131/g.72501 Transcript_23131/m.72501 type:complete len:131 (+) Transcript_23131:247-639(+)